MKQSELHAEAEEDIIHAIEFYNSCRSGLGEIFFTQYLRTRSFIERFPEGTPRYRYNQDVRKIPIGDFPYSIYYLNLDDKVLILAIIHDSRRPGFWFSRFQTM
ncbi:plasmid stabilization system protein, RelE/ParE family [Leptospira weilii str. Ecochallenge]|uniref:Plasmid stabilization system protein, RelE/ParE family n=2 Tax=Leptospira weilii TaxID=28184 RepID=N1UEE1_9LEPT|nr:type II toxin-antitoxin system RelE/ParE family toxin [Leptospira weilii]EMN91341.1 plasmid stabilization system protein, RelE/ParE family [Leptospira weilii str. UI 13098]EMY14400.1 plasmid stabilization system protein, RelE/ParE family [Leptospira weilii str. Ecochallenge]